MNEQTKESKFLDAINKYAEKQKATISSEVEEYKNQRIEQATEQGLKDAYELIRRDIAKQKAELVTEVSAKETALRVSQFELRRQIHDEVFQKAKSRLVDFAASDEYDRYIQKCIDEIRTLFQEDDVVFSLAKKDSRYADMIKTAFPNAIVKTVDSIVIGGLKAYSNATGVLADDTLDTKLKDQHEWFINHSGLKVV